VAAEEGQLLRGLNALGGDLQAEPVGERDTAELSVISTSR
jgi:hypothetical protein